MHGIRYAAAALLATSIAADAAERRAHDAHVHGEARMNIAVAEGTVEIELISPAMDIVGFEHEPRDAAQEQAMTDALDRLRDGERLFSLSSAADCRMTAVEAASSLGPDHGRHEAPAGHHAENAEERHSEPHDHAESGRHSEVRARYEFRCAEPGSLHDIRIGGFFDWFSGTRTVGVQLLTPNEQQALELTPDSPAVSW